jgi:hypothetical protein
LKAPFKFSARTRVGFSDTDAHGIVYYGRYLPYIDLARVEYHRKLGLLGMEVGEPGAEARPLPHEIEHGPLGDRGDPAAHLRVDDDSHDTDHDHPQELKAERRTGLRVEDEVADVDEPADRRENAKSDREEVLQAHLRPSAIWLL